MVSIRESKRCVVILVFGMKGMQLGMESESKVRSAGDWGDRREKTDPMKKKDRKKGTKPYVVLGRGHRVCVLRERESPVMSLCSCV